MSFIDHARAHGLVIRHLIADDRWHRCQTTDHPKKKNGAYIYDGTKGAVQNWATMQAIALFRPEGVQRVPRENYRSFVRNSLLRERSRQFDAAIKAREIVRDCARKTHPYLKLKGFPLVRGLVHPSGDLVIPMWEFNTWVLNSVQRISPAGTKLFLTDGKARGSVFIVGRGQQRERWLCEGYATALSLQAALTDLRAQAEIICCFSAGNLMRIAELVRRPAYVMADNDESHAGLTAAIASGLPYVMPNEVGTDANDLHQQRGLRRLVDLVRSVHDLRAG